MDFCIVARKVTLPPCGVCLWKVNHPADQNFLELDVDKDTIANSSTCFC